MSNLTGNERATYVQSMFGRIAHRYDLLNRLMTLGQDNKWRREAIIHLEIDTKDVVVDLGTGTGDIAFEISEKYPENFVVASDFTAKMILVGKERKQGDSVAWVIADAQKLPFASSSVAAVVSGFLLRNVPDVDVALSEQHRILTLNGRVVSLDTSPPRKNILRPFLMFHLHIIIPLMGKIIAGDAEAYTYLPSSTEKFLTAEKLQERFEKAGFNHVSFVRRMLGTVGIHWGKKSS
jgi:demethylmenaquinone methyltransferase / 2-methoxy-6-polyprenyl-1,4-benzoquinol methylase